MAFQKFVKGQHGSLLCNNTTAVAYPNRQGGTVSWKLCICTGHLATPCVMRNIPCGHPCAGNAQYPSQVAEQGEVLHHEWEFNPSSLQTVFAAWGTPSLDVFGTQETQNVRQIVCREGDTQNPLGTAFCFHGHRDLYAFSSPSPDPMGPAEGPERQAKGHCHHTMVTFILPLISLWYTQV